ncbi:MAG: hypothetical protein M3O70_23300 [Actinomycetota bacterium]|nr:hypothetical protein [Actinomycetota bacterium]
MFAGVFASAASLSVSTETLGAGGTSVASCDTNGVKATYTTAYDSTVPGYKVSSITVTGIADTCSNLSYKIQATKTDGAALTAASGTLGAFTTGTSDNSVSATPGTTLKAAEVEGIYVVISG